VATTQLFVELLIIGIGVAIWLALGAAAVVHYSPHQQLPALDQPIIAAGVGVAYVTGILVDRIARRLFEPLERCHQSRIFGEDPQPSPEDRERYVHARGSALGDQILYNRSRLRICRAWTLNFALIALGSWIWGVQQQLWSITLVATTSLVLCCISGVTANSLVRDHWRNVRASYEFLAKYEKSGGAPQERAHD
jgi:xanthine/uracil permease